MIEIGKVINTHGIKGEIKILTDLTDDQKKQVFAIGSHLVVQNCSYTIVSYRIHKGLDMVCFEGLNNINEVLFMKGQKVYKNEQELSITKETILDSQLMTFQVLTTTGKKGMIKAIETTGINYKILRLIIDGEETLVPYHLDFIESMDVEKQQIIVKLI